MASRFPVAFRPPAFASWVIRPPLGSWAFLTVGLPGPCPDPIGVPRSARARYDRGGCLLYPGDGGALSVDKKSPTDACRFSTASPSAPPPPSHPARLTLNETSTEVHAIHPFGLPLARAPWMEQGSFGFPLMLRTPPSPATHVKGGARPLSTRPGATQPASTGPPICKLARSMRLRVAASSWYPPR